MRFIQENQDPILFEQHYEANKSQSQVTSFHKQIANQDARLSMLSVFYQVKPWDLSVFVLMF